MIDFSDTSIGDELLTRIQDLEAEIYEYEDDLRILENERDSLLDEYDNARMAYEVGLVGGGNDEEN